MKNHYAITIAVSYTVIILFSISCKVKKQSVTTDAVASKSKTQLSANKQQTASYVQHIIDSSKSTKNDSAFLSVVERTNIEYDYPNPSVGSPSKIIHSTERTTNFKNGTKAIDQKNIKSYVNAVLINNEKKNGTEIIKANESYRFITQLTSSPIYWVWAIAVVVFLLAIYVIRKFNLINLVRSFAAKFI